MDHQSNQLQPYHNGPVVRMSASSESPNAFDPWLLWITLRRCWYWAIPVGVVLAVIAAFAVLQSFVPQFQATHHLAANKDWLIDSGVMPTPDDLARSEKTLITSPIVLSQVIDKPELQAYGLQDPDPDVREQTLISNLSIRGGGTRSAMSISYIDSDKKFAADVCNAVVEAYLQKRDEYDNRRIGRLEQWLTPQVEQLKRKVEEQEKLVSQLAKEAHGVAPGERVAAIENSDSIALVEKLRGEISDLEIELALMDAGIGIRNPSASDNIIVPSVAEFVPPVIQVERGEIDPDRLESLILNDKVVARAQEMYEIYRKQVLELEISERWRFDKERYARLQKDRDEWEAKLASARETASKTAVRILEDEIEEDYQRQLELAELEKERLRAEFAANADAKKAELERRSELMSEQEKLLIGDRRDQLVKRLQVLQDQYKTESDRLRQRDGNSVALQFANDDLERSRSMLHRIVDRLESIQMESKRGSSVISIAAATPPSRPVEAVPFKKMVMAGGGAFAIPFLIGLLWEFRTKRITDSLDLEKSHTLAPVVGELARAPRAASGRNSKSRRVFEESVDALRANLALSKDTRHARSFAVVSSMSGEGKSTAVSQLAISLAKSSGKTVLIIDCDMRCPDQHDVFGLALEPGLNEVLRKVVPMKEAINRELGDLVHVLPAGHLKASPHRLVSPDSMKELMDEALDSYQYVILDTAPVLSAGETLAIASVVDSTLVCVMRDLTRMDSVVRTTHRLEASGANVVGTIFSGVTPRQYSYRYGDYKYSDFGQMLAETAHRN
ncbi:Tyrosine-protein kinase YwqD [Stieleria neptunia]|uniref:Tyrosine-protein kinase YwqD n=1 Tax=Stieleria neptunia TaxID=2527979 RepID=A0A518HQS9_9BACT|nr:polysaccharide biosynthesis tyrosine autokinase [Stieleria neptunia]QDV43209.1 Tyrosine-protein kinase YwqD [Stieleria neptunia]